MEVDISFDKGATWQFFAGFTATGGTVTNPATGLPATVSSVSVNLPQVGNSNRVLRGILTVFSQLTTNVSFSVS
jgi:hypothetical protein